MQSFSPYAVPENQRPQWKVGEELAASAFVGITLFLVVENLFEIVRLFKKRQGLYFWSMIVGTCGCAVDTLGIILKYLTPHSAIWALYTLCMLAGWSMYALSQLLVLYSRLHLVTHNARAQRCILVVILSTVLWIMLPTWVVVWPAYDTDPMVSSLWSPRDAIVERYTQIGSTLVECVVSGVYIHSLILLLRFKTSVRQRRVLLDLLYVNILAIAFDVLTIILVYLNQLGSSHPIQTFSYALKLRLEFVTLNQLMAVAARGLNRETFEEKRYHHTSQQDSFSAELRRFGEAYPTSSSDPKSESAGQVETRQVPNREDPSKQSLQISVPSPVLSRGHHLSTSVSSDKALPPPPPRPAPHTSPKGDLSEKSLQLPESPILKAEDPPPHRRRIKAALRSVRPRSWRDPDSTESRPLSRHGGEIGGRERERQPRRLTYNDEEEEQEEEIGLHMWENRGKVILEVPWFKNPAQGA
ncbi:MAG: hypothetical protein Q9191_006515 [Dirinaria sp. TL-2023a]